jgi:RNA polymerase sigma-70 factor, ECF subfamily
MILPDAVAGRMPPLYSEPAPTPEMCGYVRGQKRACGRTRMDLGRFRFCTTDRLAYTSPVASQPDSPTVTILLNDYPDASARVRQLLPLVYDQLRAAAQNCLRSERTGHTFQATALVHEAYLKLVGPRDIPWQNRAHFYAAAAEAMRRILVDHARAKAAGCRGGPEARQVAVNLGSLPDPDSESESAGFLILDEAIARLEGVDTDAAAVVRLRYFAGLSIDQTAAALGVSAPTVKRAWAFARGWLKEAIEAGRV